MSLVRYWGAFERQQNQTGECTCDGAKQCVRVKAEAPRESNRLANSPGVVANECGGVGSTCNAVQMSAGQTECNGTRHIESDAAEHVHKCSMFKAEWNEA